jgi:hypothetical protein
VSDQKPSKPTLLVGHVAERLARVLDGDVAHDSVMQTSAAIVQAA